MRNIEEDSCASRLAERAPEPFETACAYHAWCATKLARPHVKGAAEPHAKTERGQGVRVAVEPYLLRGEAEANEENIGRSSAKLGKHGIVFLALAIKIAVMGVADVQLGKSLSEIF